MRLGIGAEGTPQSMSELKQHPWFTEAGFKKGEKLKKLDMSDSKKDVTKYCEQPIPEWDDMYQMKFICERLANYY